MFHNMATLSIPNWVLSVLEKVLNAEDDQFMFDGFMMECFLTFEKVLKKKIAANGEQAVKDEKYFSRYSKSFKLPNSDITIKYTANVRWVESYKSKTLSPTVTGIDVCIPSLRGKTFISLKDYVDQATSQIIQREILGGSK